MFIGREPGPALRMFSAKYFLTTDILEHNKFVMATLNSGPFGLTGPETPFSCLKLCAFTYLVIVGPNIAVEKQHLAESILRHRGRWRFMI